MHTLASRAIAGSPITPLVEEFYGPSGPLVERGWEIRPQQREMSLRIAGQIDRCYPPGLKGCGRIPDQWGIVEAPCGTGKGQAYLIPGVLLALRQRAEWEQTKEAYEEAQKSEDAPPMPEPPKYPRKLVISTANIALQEQLVWKDIPALADMLDLEALPVGLLKGRNNYLCRHKLRALDGELFSDPTMQPILEWARSPGCTGDKERFPFDPGDLWQDVSVLTEDCLGESCAHWREHGDGSLCFWRKAVIGYETALVVVTNHHYLAKLKGIFCGLLAVDEMHELERSLRASETRTLAEHTGRQLSARATRFLSEGVAKAAFHHPVQWLMEQVSRHHQAHQPVLPFTPKTPVDTPVSLPFGWLTEDITTLLERMDHAVTTLIEKAVTEHGCHFDGEGTLRAPAYKEDRKDEIEEAGRLVRLIEAAAAFLEKWEAVATGCPLDAWEASHLPWAIYSEMLPTRTKERRIGVSLAPADVSWATRKLAGSYPCAVFTSATIPDFSALKLSLGMTGVLPNGTGAPEPAYAIRLPSPYDLPNMGVLIVPAGPSPKDQGWEDWTVGQILEAVALARGGVLVLASSTRQMRRYGWELKQESNWQGTGFQPRVKVQGDEGRASLRQWFKEDVDSVLVATRSFFQGLDIQGDACRLVIMDRVPFARPDDPVEQAVQQLLVERAGGGNGYLLRSVPEAAMVLAQGAGRLIRSQQDRGAVLLLDSRVLGKGEGWQQLRAALPPFPLSRDPSDLRNLLDGQPLIGVAPPPLLSTPRNRI